jgi:hypothetical protein
MGATASQRYVPPARDAMDALLDEASRPFVSPGVTSTGTAPPATFHDEETLRVQRAPCPSCGDEPRSAPPRIQPGPPDGGPDPGYGTPSGQEPAGRDPAPLEALVAQWRTSVGAAIAPILARYNLSDTTPTAQVTPNAALCDELLAAARRVMTGAPAVFEPETALAPPPRAVGPELSLGLARNPRTGEVVYPDIPPFDAPPVEHGPDFGCLDRGQSPRTVAALDSLENDRKADARIAALPHMDGMDYSRLRVWIDEAAIGRRHRYSCKRGKHTPDFLAQYRKDQDLIHLYPRLESLEPLTDLGISLLFGATDFRAGVILHEIVHRFDHIQEVEPVHMNFDGAICSRTEFRAAYMQAKYYGGTDCDARAMGNIYSRSGVGTPCEGVLLTRSQEQLGAVDDITRCVDLWPFILDAVILAAMLALGGAALFAALLSLFGAPLAMLLLWIFP